MKMFKRLLSIFLTTAILSGILTTVSFSAAAESVPVEVSLMGAQIRVNKNLSTAKDMRFVGKIQADVFDTNEDNLLEIGMLIAKRVDLDKNNVELNMDLYNNQANYGITVKKAAVGYLVDTYKNNTDDPHYRFHVALLNIDPEKYVTYYTAMPYIIYSEAGTNAQKIAVGEDIDRRICDVTVTEPEGGVTEEDMESSVEDSEFGDDDGTENTSKLIADSNFDCHVGDMIDLTAVEGTSQVLCNDVGMSGLWSPAHMQAAFSSSKQSSYVNESMYATSEAKSFTFDCGAKYALGGLFIWNYNDTDHLDYGLKDVIISYSEDGSNWNDYGSFTLAQCNSYDNTNHEGNTATNTTTDNRGIDFNGTCARYIRITPTSNYGGSMYGLSEIRLFMQKTVPSSGDMIYSEAYTTKVENDKPENLINNSGMSNINASKYYGAGASNDANDMWLSNGTADDSLVAFNLDGAYPIDTVRIWNYNDSSNLGYGIKEFKLYYTVREPMNISRIDTSKYANYAEVVASGERDTVDFSKGSWTLAGTYTLPQGTGKDGMGKSLDIDLGNVHAQHIKIVPVSNYAGTANNFGLSEVRFYSGSGWAAEYSRTWSGLLSNSGCFKWQGSTAADGFSGSTGGGWLGGDGTMSTPLNGTAYQNNGSINANSKTLFTFQDSWVGCMGNYRTFTPSGGYLNSNGLTMGMKNMAYMTLKGDVPDPRNVQWYTQNPDGSSGNNHLGNIYPSWYSNYDGDGNEYWYGADENHKTDNDRGFWLLYSVCLNNKVYTLAGRVWGDGWSKGINDLYSHDLGSDGFPNMTDSAIRIEVQGENSPLRYTDANGKTYTFESPYTGENDGYVYLYGTYNGFSESGNMIVMRIKESDYPTLSNPKYWNGSDWVDDITQCARISSYATSGNVTKMTSGPFNGKYVNVHTESGIMGTTGGQLKFGISDSITGPFNYPSDESNGYLFYAPEYYEVSFNTYSESPFVIAQWNYNGKSHPAISGEGELLSTYNYGVHDDRKYSDGTSIIEATWIFGFTTKEYEHSKFVRMFEIAE